MTEPENLHHLWWYSLCLQPRQMFRAFLLGCRVLLLRCRTCLGRLSGRPFPGVGGRSLLVLVGRWEFPRDPLGGLTCNPCTLGFRRMGYLPGSFGLLLDLPGVFGSLGCFRPATSGAFPKPQHIPELLRSFTCLVRQLREFRPMLALLRLLLPRLLADTGQFELLASLQCQSTCPDFASVGPRYDLVREPIPEIPNQSSDEFLGLTRYELAFDGSQYMLMHLTIGEKRTYYLELSFVLISLDSAGFLFDGADFSPIVFDLVESSFTHAFDAVQPRLMNVSVLVVAEEPVGAVFEYSAAFMVPDLVAVSVVSIRHSWTHPPVCVVSW
ncbi:hypothetical protein [Nocardia sp. NPDC047038]|uniref:hypothetical protein n=1 Tax=Nocardia sp. NPDC047038 TaxID=3154338 RepID=UPI0033DCAECB